MQCVCTSVQVLEKVRFLTLIIIMNISFQFLEWGCDDLTIYYSRPDEQNRPFAVLMHKTCQSVLTDVVLHEEKDERLVKIIFYWAVL